MKKLAFIMLIGLTLSCNDKGTESKQTIKDSTAGTSKVAEMNYPYTIDQPDNWEIGTTANTMIALSSLKKWEEGNFDESLKYFADSITMKFDGLDTKMSNDSLKAMFRSGWSNYKTVNIKMNDWESVISKDKKQEWVTLWYRQRWETVKGEKDSADILNDIQIKDGKITRLDEYTRKLH